jgi:hypothetical protein
LKWENEHLKSMIKDHIINPDYKHSRIITDNHHEINYLKSDNESLLKIYNNCSIFLLPRFFHREKKII